MFWFICFVTLNSKHSAFSSQPTRTSRYRLGLAVQNAVSELIAQHACPLSPSSPDDPTTATLFRWHAPGVRTCRLSRSFLFPMYWLCLKTDLPDRIIGQA